MSNNDWLDIEVLDDYLEGKLDASTMHKVERVSLEDPFVAQALAGLTAVKSRTHTLSILQKKLQERVAQKPVQRKAMRMTSHRLSIGATAAVLFITASVLFWMKEANRREQAQIAASKAKNIEVSIQPEGTTAATASLQEAVALPVGGWPAYQNYLKKNNKLRSTETQGVKLSFTVNKDGSVGDVVIVNEQSEVINKEAIRLLKDGPKWNFDPQLSNKGSVTIKF